MKTEIIRVKQETRNVKTIRLKLPAEMEFKAGQFVFVYSDVQNNGDTEKIKRAFSISSSPEHKDYLEFTFNLIPGGKLSPVLYNMKEGDSLNIEGPYGNFTFNSGTSKTVVFVAGGTGIAPLMSMLRYSVKEKMDLNLILIYSVRTPDDIIYRDELLKMEKENKIKLGITISRPEGFEWEGHKGRIDHDYLKEFISDFKTPLFYTCGPPGFVQGMIKIFKEAKVDPDNIKLEAWE